MPRTPFFDSLRRAPWLGSPLLNLLLLLTLAALLAHWTWRFVAPLPPQRMPPPGLPEPETQAIVP